MHARKRGVESFEKLSREGENKEKSMSLEKKERKKYMRMKKRRKEKIGVAIKICVTTQEFRCVNFAKI
jgi:hypothetical protein